MDMKTLYIELYVSSLLAVIIYVLIELFKVEKEKAGSAAAQTPIEFPRFSIWLVGIGVFLVVAGWLLSFGINEAVKSLTKSSDYEAGLLTAAKGLFFPGVAAVAISMLVFGYKAAIHPRSPAWFSFAGIMAIAIGLLAFCASAGVGCAVRSINSETTPIPQVILITGVLNPFFFVGVPLGFYWMYRGKQPSVPRTGNR